MAVYINPHPANVQNMVSS